jgi:hypothetical protein
MIPHKCPHILVYTDNYNKFPHMIGSTFNINRKIWLTSTAAWYLHTQMIREYTRGCIYFVRSDFIDCNT